MLDLLFVNISAILALKVGFNFESTSEFLKYREILLEYRPIYSVFVLGVFYLFGLYDSLWKYASIKEFISVITASLFGVFLVYLAFRMSYIDMVSNFYVINGLMLMATAGGIRFGYRMLRVIKVYIPNKSSGFLSGSRSRVLIIGAGDSGVMTAKEIQSHIQDRKKVVGYLDDDEGKIGELLQGVPVLSKINEVGQVVDELDIDEIIISIPSLGNKRRREIFDKCKKLDVKLKTVPSLYDLIDGKIEIESIRNVEIEDLLGRDPVEIDNPEIERYVSGKVILVTGGGGSIGSELCRQISKFRPSTLIIFDIYENNAYDIQNELKRSYRDELDLKVLIGSIRDRVRLEEVFAKYRPNLVFHAAAHKHVPLMQESPFEAIKNNSLGTLNTAEIAGRYGVERFVMISTDKAVNPTNIMGASKRLAEICIQNLNQKYIKTEYMAVRFGNVLGSNGSVIPLFKKQIEQGGPVTLTHPDIIRYFMTIPEAVLLVLQAGSMSVGGEIFVLDMGEPVKILNLAKDLIRLSGFEPYEDISIEFVGLRPGEKLYEELMLSEEGVMDTLHKKIFVVHPVEMDSSEVEKAMQSINEALASKDLELMEQRIKELIPKYRGITDTKSD
ncbi:polysaccharide biosynthesis protein [Andreesenia angusta]|nr:nucleoside-diphosphate sugar epimerase/dehydratase [Andreesenia angusta]